MHVLLQMIQSLDLSIYNFLNGFVGNYFLDRLVAHLESNSLLKGGVFLAAYWYFWFRPGSNQQRHRQAIIAILFGTVLAIVVTRALAGAVPFRTRPIYNPELAHHLSVSVSDFEAWSGFPSDTAAYICALAFGLTYLSRRLTIPVIVYTAAGICLPRLYLGIHYASDIVAAAAIAVASVWAALRIEALRSRVATPLLAFIEAKPQVFYAAGFLVSYEMATIFWDIRSPLNGLLKVARAGAIHDRALLFQVVFATLSAVAIAAYVGFAHRKPLILSPLEKRQRPTQRLIPGGDLALRPDAIGGVHYDGHRTAHASARVRISRLTG